MLFFINESSNIFIKKVNNHTRFIRSSTIFINMSFNEIANFFVNNLNSFNILYILNLNNLS